MSEERMKALGVPRRKFLKSATATAFVAPVVVSFGLDGIAEGDPGHSHRHLHHHFANQFCANQSFSNQLAIEHDLVNVITLTLAGLSSNQLSFGRANSISRKALNAALAAAGDHCEDLCPKLASVVREIDRLPSSPLQSNLASAARMAQAAAGCPTT